MPSPDIPRMPIAEFRETGYLHEINRLLLHPLGLAMEVNLAAGRVRHVHLPEDVCEELELVCRESLAGKGALKVENATTLLDALSRAQRLEPGEETLGGVWDCRSDAGGVDYGEDLLDAGKAERIAAEIFSRRGFRRDMLGYVIQPVETEMPTLTLTYVNPAERHRIERKEG